MAIIISSSSGESVGLTEWSPKRRAAPQRVHSRGQVKRQDKEPWVEQWN